MVFKKCLKFSLVLSLGIFSLAFAQQRSDTTITIYAKESRTGERELASVGNCLNLYQSPHMRPKVPTVNSISFEPDLNCIRFYEYECCSGKFYDADPAKESQESNRLMKIHTNPDKDPNWFDARSVGPCLSQSSFLGPVPPPAFLVEPNSSAEEATKDNTNVKQFDDRNAAVYISYEQELGQSVNWLYNIFSLGWGYVKKTYGDFGTEGKLYGIYHGNDHSDQGKQTGAFPYRSAKSSCRNVISVFSTQKSTKSVQKGSKVELDAIARQMAQLVDFSYNGTLGTPCGELWTTAQAWEDIFRYDLYLNLGMKQDADRIARDAANRQQNQPTRGSKWFTGWFKPMYENYNGTQALVRFFQLRQQFFPKGISEIYGTAFARYMNLGEFVHFSSGAVGTNLWEEAYWAFNLYADNLYPTWKKQFDNAQRTFSEIKYKDFDKFK